MTIFSFASFSEILYLFITVLIILGKECYGYLDPSAMTYMIQIGAAVVITISTSIGIIFYKLKINTTAISFSNLFRNYCKQSNRFLLKL